MKNLLLIFAMAGLFSSIAMGQQRISPGVLPESAYDNPGDPEGFDFDFNLAPALPENFTIDTDGQLRYDPKTEIVTYDAATQIELNTDTGAQLFAKKARIFLKTKTVLLEGDVSIYQGAALSRAESATYFWETGHIKSQQLRTGFPPFYLQTTDLETIDKDGRQILVARNSGVTTHDLQQPNYWFRAEKTSIIPGERFIFNSMSLVADDRKLFYLPYFSQNFDPNMGFHFIPGARSNWGPFLLMSYGTPLLGDKDPETGIISDPSYTAEWKLDLRSRRGVGLGLDIQDNDYSRNSEFGKLSLWFTHDLDPALRRAGAPRQTPDPDRYRIDFQQRWDLKSLEPGPTGADWYLDANLSLLSDQYVLEDFFIREFRRDPAPDNTVALVRQTDSSVFTALMRVRVNDFYTTDTRLPEISFDQVKRAIFGSRILHEGQTSFGILSEELPGFRINELEAELASLPANDPRRDQIETRLSPHGYSRFHTYHELSAPLKYRDWLSIVPRLGAGYTNYQSIEGALSSESRTILTAAIDTSVKWSKSYPNLRNKTWGIDGLVHTVQPYFSLSHVATDALDPSFPAIDRLIPTTRPRPINVGRYNAIDEIQDWTIARIGVRNLLMTRRDDQSHQWLAWDLYVDAFIEDPEFDRNFSNLYNEVQWSPVPWARFGVQSQLPLFDDNSDFIELNTAATFMPNENTELTIGHRYLNSHPILPDSSLLVFSLFHRINEEWGIGMMQRWEFDDATLEEQRYTINRDFGSWVASFGGFFRDNRNQEEYGLLLGFTLKAFPSINLPLSVDAN